MRTVSLLLVLAATAGTARAGTATGPGTPTGVVVTGEATLQPTLVSQLEGWLRDHGHPLIASPLSPDAINSLIDCIVIQDKACARGVIEARAKAPAVLFAQVEVTRDDDHAGDRDVTLVAYWFQKGHDAITERRLCQHCSDHDLRAATDDLMAAMIALVRDHRLDETADGDAADGDAGAAIDEGAPRRPRVAAYALVGGGAALALTGGALLATDGRPDPHGVQPARYTDYRPAGVALVTTGVVAAAVGVYFWLRPGAHAAPVAAASRSGAYLGWAGRF